MFLTAPATKKTIFYNYMPSKVEEEAHKAAKTTYKPTKTLVEITDSNRPPTLDPFNPWKIRKVLTSPEASSGRVVISFSDTFNHIFRYWRMEMAERVVIACKRQSLVVCDVTEESTNYINDMFLEQGPDHEFYILGCMELARVRRLKAGDEVGMSWDNSTNSLQFKVLSR